ncbi:MerR family transcriptional regulator [Herbiconiux sp. CPCC 205716]|uniref:MerR family transcriptional regulator n=1 Tax=Herbiconiux gentiana TaxID=2970912 RepID=A0ABT2GGJ0_9MICO|nr:MerR family transcriptional regulator [Herbiconiux gentiana]MCS5715348.1 MerR family transcriptional regulator [Herbiconiux gentiana]
MRIGELSERSGVSPRSLRYYEEQRLLEPERTASGQRRYGEGHLAVVARILHLFGAGFCSTVIRELLPALSSPEPDRGELQAAFDAATARLTSEMSSIGAELAALDAMRSRLGLAPHTRVSVHRGEHDDFPAPAPAPIDHRDRRLR